MHYTCKLVNILRNPPINCALPIVAPLWLALIGYKIHTTAVRKERQCEKRQPRNSYVIFDDFIVSLASSFHICISYHNYVGWLAFHSRGHIHWRVRNAKQAAAAKTECATTIFLTLFRAASVRCLFCICLVFVWVLLWEAISWPNNYLAPIEYIIKFLSILFGTIGFLAVILSCSWRFDCLAVGPFTHLSVAWAGTPSSWVRGAIEKKHSILVKLPIRNTNNFSWAL